MPNTIPYPEARTATAAEPPATIVLTCIVGDMTRQELEAMLPGVRRRHLDGIEDYLWVGGHRMSARQAARRLGVTERTICRYRATLHAAGTEVSQ